VALAALYRRCTVKRTQIYLDEAQEALLAKRAFATGLTRSMVIRDAIDRYLGGQEDQHQRAARFRAAVGEAAGIAPYLPDGARYVEGLRGVDAGRHRDLDWPAVSR
jgi:hypothetical protein